MSYNGAKEDGDYMAKHRRTWNQEQYQRYLKEGRGQGTKSAYKPWIMIHDFPSNGMVSRVYGNTTGRIHHLLSNMELSYFYLLDWSEKVLDIREQYPILEIETVIEIADKAGIRYPFDNESGFPYVLTSDFLITTSDGEMVRSIKPKKNLGDFRVREKLEIERRYWKQKKIDWKLVTEDGIDHQKARNIEWIFQAENLPETFPRPEVLGECLMFFEYMYLHTGQPILKIAQDTEQRFQIETGSGLRVFQYLVLCRRIPICMSGNINLSEYRAVMTEKEARQYG
jgi:hypothetical protein